MRYLILLLALPIAGCSSPSGTEKEEVSWNVVSDIVVSDLSYSVELIAEQDSLKVEIINLTSDSLGSFTLDWRSAKSRYVKKDNIKHLPYSHSRKSNSENDIIFNTSNEGTFRVVLSSK